MLQLIVTSSPIVYVSAISLFLDLGGPGEPGTPYNRDISRLEENKEKKKYRDLVDYVGLAV